MLCCRNAAHSCYHGGGVGGCLWVLGHLQGQRWPGTGTGGSSKGVGKETQLKSLQFSLGCCGPLLNHPSVSDKNKENCCVLRREPPSSANWGQTGVFSCWWLTHASTHTRAAFLSEQTEGLSAQFQCQQAIRKTGRGGNAFFRIFVKSTMVLSGLSFH